METDFLRVAYNHAWVNSHDKSTQVGAVIVDGFRIVAYGTNRYPGNLESDTLNHERPLKYKLIEHAERSAIYWAASFGIKTDGLILVSTWACCPDCARAIVLSGIKHVYTHKRSMDRTPKRWVDDINLGIRILKNSGVGFSLIDREIGDCKNLFNGVIWKP